MKNKEIFLAKISYDKVDYPRPCVIIRVSDDTALVGLISSALDLYNPIYDFLISPEYQEFIYTGLKKKSFIKGYPFPELPIDSFIRRFGYFAGDLARDFDKWIGIK